MPAPQTIEQHRERTAAADAARAQAARMCADLGVAGTTLDYARLKTMFQIQELEETGVDPTTITPDKSAAILDTAVEWAQAITEGNGVQHG